MNWETLLKRNIAVTTGKTKTVDTPIIEDDEDCERRFWYLWSMLEADLSGKIHWKREYALIETKSVITNTTDNDYCAILEFFKNLDMEEFKMAYGSSAKKLGDTLKVEIVKIFGMTKMEYSIEIYQKSPHPLFMISIYDAEGFLEAVRRHV